MILLWISLIVCTAVIATVALSALDHQRRLFFATGSREARGGRKRKDTYGDRLRKLLSAVGGVLAGITPRRGEPRFQTTPGGNSNLSVDSAPRGSRREHAAQVVLRAMSEAGSARPPAAANGPPAENTAPLAAAINTALSVAVPTGEGLVRVDPGGQLQSPDAIARGLLHWSGGTLTLGEILAGGSTDADALLESVARREVVECTVTVVAGGVSQQLHVTALSSRSRDGSFRGALLIMRRP